MPATNKTTLTELAGRFLGGGKASVRQLYPDTRGFLIFPPQGSKPTPLVWTPEISVDGGKTLTQQVEKNPNICFYAADSAVAVPLEKKGRNKYQAITIGRGEDNDIRLKTKIVSKVHTFIWEEADSFIVEDKGSTNGTFINGVRLPAGEKYRLPLGTELGISEIQCLLVDFDCLIELIKIVSK